MIEVQQAELNRILASRVFARSERHRRFLEWTVERALAGRSWEIKESSVGVEVFGRPAGYDPQIDPIVRVEVARLRSKLERYYETEGRADEFALQYPKGSYIPVFERRAPAAEVPANGNACGGPRTVERKTTQARMPVLLGAVGVLGLAGLLIFRPSVSPTPRIGAVKVVAHQAEVQSGFVADSHRLFFVQRNNNRWTLAQASLEGGPAVPIPAPFETPFVFDVSPDESKLLIGGGEDALEQSLWVMPSAGGTPQRLDGLTGAGAAWSPDGGRLAYVRGPQLFLANADGSASRAIARFPGDWVAAPRWSPDQKRIRLLMAGKKDTTDSIWEVSSAGANPHPLLPGWHAERMRCGVWVEGGRFFVFSARVNGAWNLWVLPEGSREPVQLTAGPVGLTMPAASRDGKRLLAVNTATNGELVRYDAARDAVDPYLGGISAAWVSFSRDGQSIAYSSYPDRSLWRSKIDGTEAVQLTHPPLTAWSSSWSQDGRIAAMTVAPGAGARILLFPASGGTPETIPGGGEQVGASFSPGGDRVAFGGPCAQSNGQSISVYDFRTRSTSEIPDSKGYCAPAWSPDGRFIAALDVVRGGALMLWDAGKRAWRQLLGPGWKHDPHWTADSRYLLFQSLADPDGAIHRVRVADGRLEKIVDAKRFARADVSHSVFTGLSPDGSPLVILFRNDYDISAMDLEFR